MSGFLCLKFLRSAASGSETLFGSADRPVLVRAALDDPPLADFATAIALGAEMDGGIGMLVKISAAFADPHGLVVRRENRGEDLICNPPHVAHRLFLICI